MTDSESPLWMASNQLRSWLGAFAHLTPLVLRGTHLSQAAVGQIVDEMALVSGMTRGDHVIG